MKDLKSDGKTYSADTCMFAFDFSASNVAMKQIPTEIHYPHLIKQNHLCARYNVEEALEKTCVEDLACQQGVVTEL